MDNYAIDSERELCPRCGKRCTNASRQGFCQTFRCDCGTCWKAVRSSKSDFEASRVKGRHVRVWSIKLI